MILGCIIVGTAASLVAAVCAALCLWRLEAPGEPEVTATEASEDEGDTALREGILNLMRYTPTGEREKEE